jgi:DNA-binding transcriptional ArsR family regulator
MQMKTKPTRKQEQKNDAPFAYEGLDRVIHERARLGILTSLITHPKGLTFGDLKQLCALTDGNLSRHLSLLEEERIVAIEKSVEKNRPLTICRITALGSKRYFEYLTALEQVVRDAAKAGYEQASDLQGLTPSRA